MEKHLKAQTDIYGNLAMVNLINQKGHEKPVKDAYERHIAQVRIALLFLSGGLSYAPVS